MSKGTTLIGGLTASVIVCTSALAAGTIVNIELQDSTSDSASRDMKMALDHSSVKTGQVTFRIRNESETLVHEMLVIPLDAPALPYDTKKDVFIEAKVKSLGEVEELRPGASGKLTLDLRPGPYLLTCNQPGHLHAGMWTKFTVLP